MESLVLYHGTYSKFKNKILKEGLKPRSLTKYEGNWKESPSIENLIYLTDCYPIYFSVSAINSLEEENLCLFKVKVNANYLYPDEDFIYQLSKKQEETISSEESKKIVYLNKELWKGSLKHLGTVSYNKIILPSEILDYVEVSPKENPEIIWEGIQPTITLENKFIFGNKYKELTEYLFNLNNESK